VVQIGVQRGAFESRNGIFRSVEILGQLPERMPLMLLFVFTPVFVINLLYSSDNLRFSRYTGQLL
jgi:hypothetical protein